MWYLLFTIVGISSGFLALWGCKTCSRETCITTTLQCLGATDRKVRWWMGWPLPESYALEEDEPTSPEPNNGPPVSLEFEVQFAECVHTPAAENPIPGKFEFHKRSCDLPLICERGTLSMLTYKPRRGPNQNRKYKLAISTNETKTQIREATHDYPSQVTVPTILVVSATIGGQPFLVTDLFRELAGEAGDFYLNAHVSLWSVFAYIAATRRVTAREIQENRPSQLRIVCLESNSEFNNDKINTFVMRDVDYHFVFRAKMAHNGYIGEPAQVQRYVAPGGKCGIQAIAAARTMTAADSNTLFTVSGATYTITLGTPAAMKGVTFEFVLSAAVTAVAFTSSTASTIYANGSAGSAVHANIAAATTITHSGGAIGDYLKFTSDGTNWYCQFAIETTGDLA